MLKSININLHNLSKRNVHVAVAPFQPNFRTYETSLLFLFHYLLWVCHPLF